MTKVKTGRRGEQIAATHLGAQGFLLLESNWRYEHCEIDLIMQEKDTIVFVEVKSRSTHLYGWPEKAVTPAKQRHLVKAADAYLIDNSLDKEIRFDVVSILFYPDRTDIYHIRDAFIP